MNRETRRGFAAGLLLAGVAGAQAAPGAVKLGRKLRLGLIGNEGHPGEVTGPLARLPEVELVAFSHADAKTLAGFRAPRGRAEPQRYADYRRMLDEARLDLVAICNSNGDRAAAILAATERKLDFIAEKPYAIERADLDRVRAAVEKSRVKYGMLLPMRFEPHYRALRELVREGVIGEVCQMESQKSYKRGSRAEWFKKRSSYGGTIAWIGIHMIDLMRFASLRDFRSAYSVQSRIGGGADNGEMETTTGTVFELDNGGNATLHMDYFRPSTASSHGDDRLRIAGTKGVVEYMAATGVTVLAEGRKPETLRELPAGGSVFVDFLESAYAGKPADLTARDIWRANEVTLAARDSAEQGRRMEC